jgi:hypothetical protein
VVENLGFLETPMRIHTPILAALVAVLSLSGCLGEKIALPPVTVTVSVLDGFTYGPGMGLPAGTPLKKYIISSGLECNLPTEDQIMAEVRRQAGDLVAKLVEIDKILVENIVVTATKGDFKSISQVEMALVAANLKDFKPRYLGKAWSPTGFEGKLTVAPAQQPDMLPILRLDKPACGAALVAIDGIAPAGDVVFDIDMTVTVHAKAGIL